MILGARSRWGAARGGWGPDTENTSFRCRVAAAGWRMGRRSCPLPRGDRSCASSRCRSCSSSRSWRPQSPQPSRPPRPQAPPPRSPRSVTATATTAGAACVPTSATTTAPAAPATAPTTSAARSASSAPITTGSTPTTTGPPASPEAWSRRRPARSDLRRELPQHPLRPYHRPQERAAANRHPLPGAGVDRQVALDRVPLVVRADQLVQLAVLAARAALGGKGAPRRREPVPVRPVLGPQRLPLRPQHPPLPLERTVDLRHPLHPARRIVRAQQVGLDRPLRDPRALGQRLADPRQVCGALAQQPLGRSQLALLGWTAVLVAHRPPL